MSNKHYIGLDLTGFEDKGEARPVSRVTLYVDDEHVITAGDDTGLELTGDCPHATQAMADAILERVKGYKYKMYSATSANLDPAAELGDGVTAGGIYSVISRISDGGDGYPDLDAPGEAEPEDEFPTEGPITRAFNKKISDTRATITKTAEDITLSVSKTYSTKTELSQAKTDAAADATSKANKALSDANAATDEKLGDYSTTVEMNSAIKQTAESINQTVSKKVGYDEIISSINQTAEKVTINASKISLEGLVTVNKTFKIDENGYLQCTGGTIGGFTIGTSSLYNGMASLTSTTNGVYVGTNGIGLGGGKFKVTSAGELTAVKGKIGNWEITENGLHNRFEEAGTPYGDITSDISITAPKAGGSNFLYLSFSGSNAGPDGKPSTNTFYVTAQGELHADSAYIKGELHSTVGNIGGFTLKSGALYNGLSTFTGTTNGVYIGTDGISLGGGKFKVDSQGNLTASSGTFTGKVRANQIQVGGDNGYITGSQVGSATLTGGNIGSNTIGNGNMGQDSISNWNLQSQSVKNSTIMNSAGITSGKFSQDVQNILADAITAGKVIAGTTSVDTLKADNFQLAGHRINRGTISYKNSSNTNATMNVLTWTA